MKNFALIGAGGYIAPRHMKAIKDTGNNLLAALDKHDSVGILDSYFPQADFFIEFERFDRHLEKLRRKNTPIDYLTICSPNYLHDSHIRFGLRIGADVICEKPVVLSPWNLDALIELERESGKNVFTIMQLRLHPAVIALRERVLNGSELKKYEIDLKYITTRGNWYQTSWKGDIQKSGGIATNIGIHFFDMLVWIFGDVKESIVNEHSATLACGRLILEKASVNWLLSIEGSMLPKNIKEQGKRTYRSILIDGEHVEFDDSFDDLHTKSYEEIMSGRGFPLIESRKSLQLVHEIKTFQINNV